MAGKEEAMMLRSRAFDWGLSLFTRVPEAFPAEYLETLRTRVVESPYLGANNLNYRFKGTQGYSIVFRRPGLARVVAEFPWFEPYLEAVLDDDCNAFFLNPLVLGEVAEGEPLARVATHVDRSLRSHTLPIEPPNPRRVTVLYVQVPPGMKGGVLRFHRGLFPMGIRPRQNTLMQFQGWLRHEVTPVELPPGTRRISLVCEHYQLEADLLAHVPEFTVRSTSAFEGFLGVELGRENDEGDVEDDVPLDGAGAATCS